MAYSAEIGVKVNGLNSIKTLETSLNKISGKINAINKISVGSTKASRVEKEIAKSKEAQRVSMIQTRRVGDAIQREADKGLQTDKARAAIKRAAKADSQGQLKVAIEQRKIALEELQTQQKITEVVKSRTLTGFGPKSPVFGRSTQMDSAGNTAAILQDPTTKVSPVQQALEKMEKRSDKNKKQAVLNRKKSLSLGKDIVRIKTREANLDKKRLSSLAKETKLQKEIKSGKFATLKAGMQGPALPPVQGPAVGPTSMGLNFGRRGELLTGPAGSGKFKPQNLLRRFDRQSALISGGFPLLFGQGPVTAAAGALGGGIGGAFGQMGGFAGGIAATAAVQSISNAVDGVAKLGSALNEATKDVDALVSALGITGTEFEKNFNTLKKLGSEEAVFEAARQKMINLVGQEGVTALENFGRATSELSNQFTVAMTQMQAAFAEAFSGSGIGQAITNRLTSANLQRQAQKSTNVDVVEARDLLQAKKVEFSIFKASEAQKALIEKFPDVKTIDDALKNIEAVQKRVNVEDEQAALDKIRSDIQKARLKDIEAEINLLKNNKDLSNEDLDIEKQIMSMKELGEIKDENEIRRKLKKLNLLRDERDLALEIESAFKQINTTIGNDIKEGIKGLIKGTSTLGDLLNNVADKFLDVALNQALFGDILGAGGKKGGGILGFLTGGLLADGGRAAGGKSFIVGEKGPELFVPRSTGTVIPNNKLGGGGNTSVVVNVDASGSDVQGDEAEAKELGTLISVAVQGELLKQQRPGGLLSR